MSRGARERLIVALDVPDAPRAFRLVEALRGEVGLFKVGSQLFTAAGPSFVRELAASGAGVFLDLKYHDIPSTVASAVTEAKGLGVTLLTVHGLGGRDMIAAAARAAEGSGARVIAITVLTSHDARTLEDIGLPGLLSDAVRRLALLAKAAGAHGVVASPYEVALVREACGPEFLVVTPGIRPAAAAANDQARAATPAMALRAGADYLVVGRPIIADPDPLAAARRMVEELEAAAPAAR